VKAGRHGGMLAAGFFLRFYGPLTCPRIKAAGGRSECIRTSMPRPTPTSRPISWRPAARW